MNALKAHSTAYRFGLVLNLQFHTKKKWVSAYTPFLVDEIIREFNPIIISSQLQYYLNKKKIDRILSFEPGISAPRIKYDNRISCKKAIIYSDPHYQPEARSKYFDDNHFDAVFSLYKSPFFRHFKNFNPTKFIHWPWAVPDQFINKKDLSLQSSEIAIFGGMQSDAYDIRNWCRMQRGITSYEYSGVENKKLNDHSYYEWLRSFDAIVAAGSSNPDYDLVTPKYFEIAGSGALLFGQHCSDLSTLGFNENNSLIFTKENFIDLVAQYQKNPTKFQPLREKGRQLISERHKLSDRIKVLKDFFDGS